MTEIMRWARLKRFGHIIRRLLSKYITLAFNQGFPNNKPHDCLRTSCLLRFFKRSLGHPSQRCKCETLRNGRWSSC